MLHVIFKSVELPNTPYLAIEPSAGVIPSVFKRLDIFRDDEQNVNSAIWCSVFILACVRHKDSNVYIATDLWAQLYGGEMTLSEIFNDATTADFKSFVEWFMFQIPNSIAAEWFKLIDESFLLSKKKRDAEKND